MSEAQVHRKDILAQRSKGLPLQAQSADDNQPKRLDVIQDQPEEH